MKKVINTERIPIKLWLDDIEDGALQQAKNLANLFFAYKWIAIMPDSHEGFGMPIGGVLATTEMIIPNAVGVDIGCGMLAARTDLAELDEATIRAFLSRVRQVVPLGFEHQKTDQPWKGFNRAPDISVIQNELPSARRQLGTLGGGNHFIEIQKGSDGHIWLMIHSGSRNFGYKTAAFFHKKALDFSQRLKQGIPHKDLSFLSMDSRDGQEYYEAMKYCCDFAQANRGLMLKNISSILNALTGSRNLEEVNIHHNYAAFETHYGREVLVHRKGATKATRETIGIIPGSMGDFSYIVRGLGNPESFESCAHGAGRRMGRKEAVRSLDLMEEQKKMTGIVHGLRTKNGLDEAPGAYKNIDEVMDNQKDLVQIITSLRPLGSIKG